MSLVPAGRVLGLLRHLISLWQSLSWHTQTDTQRQSHTQNETPLSSVCGWPLSIARVVSHLDKWHAYSPTQSIQKSLIPTIGRDTLRDGARETTPSTENGQINTGLQGEGPGRRGDKTFYLHMDSNKTQTQMATTGLPRLLQTSFEPTNS